MIPASRGFWVRRAHRAAIVLGGALMVAVAPSCASRMMPTPTVLRAASAEDHSARPSSVEVLYATDRKLARDDPDRASYTNARGLALRLGIARVRYGPASIDPQTLERRVQGNARVSMHIDAIQDLGVSWRTIPLSHPETDSTDLQAPEHAFIQAVNERLPPSGRVLLYVPGFNTSFQNPIRRAADLAYLLDGDALAIAYSWPSRSTPLGYAKQLTTMSVSTRNLRELIVLLAEETEAQRIDILSYSAGAPLLTDALHQLRLMHADDTLEELRAALPIGHVIYASADDEIDRFRNIVLDGFTHLAQSITIYVSQRDLGLVLARIFASGSTRLGRAGAVLTSRDHQALQDGAETSVIDVTRAQFRAGGGDLWQHAYWFGNPWVSSDIIARLSCDLSPSERGLVWKGEENLWAFPLDYTARLEEAYLAARQRQGEPIPVVDAP